MHSSALAWKDVRRKRNYKDVVIVAQRWLEELWPDAWHLSLVAKIPGKTPYFETIPKIKIASRARKTYIGLYCAYDDPDGPAIQVCPAPRMRDEGDGLLRNLRWTILHEVQHALDDCYGSWESTNAHDDQYQRRLQRLLTVFPPTTL